LYNFEGKPSKPAAYAQHYLEHVFILTNRTEFNVILWILQGFGFVILVADCWFFSTFRILPAPSDAQTVSSQQLNALSCVFVIGFRTVLE